MMAKKKTIETLVATTLSDDIQPRIRLINVAEPPARKAGIKVNSVTELLEKLRTEEGITL